MISTSHRNYFGHFVSPALVMIFGLGIGMFLVCAGFSKNSLKQKNTSQSYSFDFVLKIIWLFGFIYALVHSYKYFDRWKIDLDDPKYSDVIPQIGFMVRRFLNGEFPYQIIDFGGHQLFPTYQPFQWFPYIVAEVGNFDYRFVAFFALGCSLLLFHFILLKSNLSKLYKVAFTISPWLLLNLFINSGKHEYAITVENLIAAYYLFFVFSIFSKSILCKGIATIMCLLSRYTLVLWLPLYCLTVLIENRNDVLKYGGIVITGLLLFYVFPFMTKDIEILIKGFDYHTKAAADLWKIVDGRPPPGLFQGMGLSSFFYSYVDGNYLAKLSSIKFIHLLVTSTCVLFFTVIFLKCKKQIFKRNIYILGSFKIYITLFYSFIQVPFNYLYIVSLFISLFCVFKFIENSENNI